MNNLSNNYERIKIALTGHENLAKLARSLDMDYKTLLNVRAGKDVKVSTLIKIEQELNKNG